VPAGWGAHLVPGVRRPLTEVGWIRIQNGCRTAVTQGYTSRRLKLRLRRSMSASASITSDQHAPPCLGLLVIVIGLERGAILPLGRGELRPVRRAEDHFLAIHDVVHRKDYHLAVRDEADPPHRDGGQQSQALIRRQYLKPFMICRVPHRPIVPSSSLGSTATVLITGRSVARVESPDTPGCAR